MADVVTRLRLESSEYDSKIKRATQGLLEMERECRSVGGTLAILEKDQKQYVQALGKMDTVSKTVRGKLNELTQAYTELSVQYKRLTDEEKQGDFGKALAASLEQLKGRINETKGQLNDVNQELGNTKTESDSVSGALSELAGKFGLNVGQLTKFGVIAATATTAMKVMKDAFLDTESGIDEWGRTLEGAKGAYKVFLDTINGCDWSDFFANLSDAVKGSRDLYDALDRMGSVKTNNQLAISMTEAEIQKLRILKQQGQNVDSQIEAATKRLAALQKQGTDAGINAGRQGTFNEIRTRVNAAGGRDIVSDADIWREIGLMATQGQTYFDIQANTRNTLKDKATEYSWRTNKTTFDLDRLTNSGKRQYLLADAFTEGESALKGHLDVWNSALQEQRSNLREEYKGHSYALQGAQGGASHGGGGGDTLVSSDMKAPRLFSAELASTIPSIKELRTELSAYKAAMENATTAYDYGVAEAGAANVEKQIAAQPLALQAGLDLDTAAKVKEQMDGGLYDSIQEQLSQYAFDLDVSLKKGAGGTDMVKEGEKTAASWSKAASAVGQLGSAFNSVEDPAAKVAGTIMQAIASIALGFATASAQEGKAGIIGWIVATVAGLATMISTITAIKSATSGGYAEGGIIPGNSYSGDNQIASVNAGELILNKAQQYNIASQLEGPRLPMQLSARVSGSDLVLAINNSQTQRNKGKLIFG